MDGLRFGPDIVVVVDFSYLCRLYYEMMARPRLDNPDYNMSARPVPFAVDGAMGCLMAWLEAGPGQLFVTLDSGLSFRGKEYPQYKSFRYKPPEFWSCYELCLRDLKDNFSEDVHVVAASGWEADDVCATIASQVTKIGYRCVIAGNDKDLFQVLDDGKVNMLKRSNDQYGRPDWSFFTAKNARDKWGGLTGREQFIDFQILAGDKVDSVPHPEGVGDQTAIKLIKQYGSVAAMKLVNIPGKTGERLKEFWPQEPMVRSLVTLRIDVDYKVVPLFDALSTAQSFQGLRPYAA